MRNEKNDIESSLLKNDLEIAEMCLKRFGNASLGRGIISTYSPAAAAKILEKRTGRHIDVRKVVYSGSGKQGKPIPDEIYYIAEDRGPTGFVGKITR